MMQISEIIKRLERQGRNLERVIGAMNTDDQAHEVRDIRRSINAMADELRHCEHIQPAEYRSWQEMYEDQCCAEWDEMDGRQQDEVVSRFKAGVDMFERGEFIQEDEIMHAGFMSRMWKIDPPMHRTEADVMAALKGKGGAS